MTAVRLGWFRRARENLEIRLHAIDAPEYDQPLGREATHRLRRFAEGKRFTLRVWEPQDQFGRVVGVLYQRRLGQSVNRQMVQSGMAYRFTRYGEMNGLGLAEAERTARRRKIRRLESPQGRRPPVASPAAAARRCAQTTEHRVPSPWSDLQASPMVPTEALPTPLGSAYIRGKG